MNAPSNDMPSGMRSVGGLWKLIDELLRSVRMPSGSRAITVPLMVPRELLSKSTLPAMIDPPTRPKLLLK